MNFATRRWAAALSGTAVLVGLTAAGCTKTGPAADRFPGFTQAGTNADDSHWFVDLNTVTRTAGVVKFKVVRTLDSGYVIQSVEADCRSRMAGQEGVRFKDDGTTDRTYEADKAPVDPKQVAGAAAAVKLACDKVLAGRVIVGDFDDGKALQVLFGNYTAGDNSSIWKDFVSSSADTEFLKASPPIVHVAFSAQFVDGIVNKRILVTAATPNEADYSCHACGVLLGAYIFSNDGGKWRIEEELPYFDVSGSWGKPPELSWMKLGDTKFALHVSNSFMAQGIVGVSHQLFWVKQSAAQPIFDYSVEGDSEAHNPAATISTVADSTAELPDIRVTIVWSGVDASAPASTQQIVYRYDGTRYQKPTTSAATAQGELPPASAASMPAQGL